MDEITIFNISRAKIKNNILKKVFFSVKTILKDKRSCTLSIILAPKSFTKELNIKYKKNNSPADVLTFIYESDKKHISGEIVICPAMIEKSQFLRYLIHALLHYFGFKHNSLKAYKKMEKYQEKIVNYLDQVNKKIF